MITIKIRITSKIAIMIKITSKTAQERNYAEFCKICAARETPANLYSLGQHKAIQEQIRAKCCEICAA